jgi:hypothetical protein
MERFAQHIYTAAEAIEAKNREQHNVRGLEMNNLETRNQAIQ